MSNPVTVSSLKPQGAHRLWLLLLSVLFLGGCSSVYYKTMEKFGYEKRDILVDRVEDARDSQNDAQETFRSSLERFQSVVDTPDTELKDRYTEISDAYDDSKSMCTRSIDRGSDRQSSANERSMGTPRSCRYVPIAPSVRITP